MANDKQKSKHLSLEEREKIKKSVREGLNFSEIGMLLNRDPSTIAKEIKKHRFLVAHEKPRFMKENRCALEKTCHRKNVCKRTGKQKCKIVCRKCLQCNRLCPDFKEINCRINEHPPYVCNGCSKQRTCILDKYYYGSEHAHKEYLQTLGISRQGIDLDRDELAALDNLVSPLIRKGQPITHIYANHKEEIKVSQRTLYKYIDSGYLGVINLDLRRVVRYRKRRKRKELAPDSRLKEGRHYEDFQKYMEENPDTEVVQMDTVEGIKGGKLLLTMMFQKSSIMLQFLLEDKKKNTVLKQFNRLEEELGMETFCKTFPVILTDNGVEFADPIVLETGSDGEQRTKIFYCDPGKSCQKASIEKNHEYIRYVIPKGNTFDLLDEESVVKLMNHINNTSRPGLNERTPMELAELLFEDKVKEKLKLTIIPGDDVCLTPELLKY